MESDMEEPKRIWVLIKNSASKGRCVNCIEGVRMPSISEHELETRAPHCRLLMLAQKYCELSPFSLLPMELLVCFQVYSILTFLPRFLFWELGFLG